MAMTIHDILAMVAGDRLPIIRATTPHLAALFPLQAESGLIDPRTGQKVLGLPVGYAGRDRSGGVFFHDEYQLYQANLATNANVKIFGSVGYRKSTTAKCSIYRGAAIGYNHLVTDRKGEYTLLAKAVPGAKVLRFGTDTSLFINPLDQAMDMQTQNDLVAAMSLTALTDQRVQLNIIEKSLLWYVIADAHRAPAGRVAMLPDVVERLFEPTQEILLNMRRPMETVKAYGYELALALQRLTTGDLRGMFHRETTPGLMEETPLLVLNCEGLKGEMAVIMITLINFFTQSQWSGQNPQKRFHKIYHDEAWDLAAYPGFVESIRRAFKLGGTWGVSNIIVAHHLNNLKRSGSIEAIRDLVADSETTILFRQDETELRDSADELNLSEAEIRRIIKFPRGKMMYKIGDRQGIEVEQVVWPEEMPLVETRGLMKGQSTEESTDLPRAR